MKKDYYAQESVTECIASIPQLKEQFPRKIDIDEVLEQSKKSLIEMKECNIPLNVISEHYKKFGINLSVNKLTIFFRNLTPVKPKKKKVVKPIIESNLNHETVSNEVITNEQ